MLGTLRIRTRGWAIGTWGLHSGKVVQTRTGGLVFRARECLLETPVVHTCNQPVSFLTWWSFLVFKRCFVLKAQDLFWVGSSGSCYQVPQCPFTVSFFGVLGSQGANLPLESGGPRLVHSGPTALRVARCALRFGRSAASLQLRDADLLEAWSRGEPGAQSVYNWLVKKYVPQMSGLGGNMNQHPVHILVV